MSDRPKPEDVADAVSRMLNVMGAEQDISRFLDQMAKDHPTLQQVFTGLCVGWFRHLAAMYDKGWYDMRNEQSCKLGKAFVEEFDKDTDRGRKSWLPFN